MTGPRPGTVLCGRYRVLAPLGAGAQASVWRCEQITTGLPVAIKIIRSDLLEARGAADRFQREAKAVAQLRSANVVRLVDYDVDRDEGPFIAMELLEGETLGARLERAGALPPQELLRLFQQMARGLDHAHRSGIVHRDLKPENVFLARDEDGVEVVKLLDFGVAKHPLAAGQRGLTLAGHLVGTIGYMSPEQAMDRDVDHRSDLWSLGVIAYECLVGRPPFAGDSLAACLLAIIDRPLPIPSRESPALPAELDAWFERACARPPGDRFASSPEMDAALESVWATSARWRARRNLMPPPALDEPVEEAPAYYVTEGDITVGPVTGELLLRGIDAGRVPENALVWRDGWPDWQPVSLVNAWLRQGAPLAIPSASGPELNEASGLLALGRPSMPPPSAPPSMAPPAMVRAEGDESDEEVFHVYDGVNTVGPITATLLCRSVVLRLAPRRAMVWREGWNDWRPIADVVWELAGIRVPRESDTSAPPSARALGSPSMMPPGAPPTPSMAPESG
jgi:serine/threonine-protein kinase